MSMNSKEVMLCFSDKSKNMHCIMEQDWKEFFDFLKLRWITFNPNTTLKCYGVQDKSLMAYHITGAQTKYDITNTPPESSRLRDLEVLGQKDFEAQQRGELPDIDQDA